MTAQPLSELETKIWALRQKGCTSAVIAHRLNLGVHFRTVDRYIREIEIKLGLRARRPKDTNAPRRPLARPVIERTAREHGFTLADLVSKSRERSIVEVRHRAMLRARVETGRSYTEIARVFGYDHSSVVYAIKKMAAKEGDACAKP